VHFVLIHSLAVGPSTWQPVCDLLRRRGHAVDLPDLTGVAVGELPSGPRIARRVADEVDAVTDENIAIVTHSNAGLFAPAIGEALSKASISYLFVDASVPPPSGSTTIAGEFISDLRTKADGDRLPRWTDWWDEAEIAPILPVSVELRETITREQPRLPLSWYEQAVDVPAGWDRLPCAYVYFGPPYDEIVDELVQRGWPVRHVPGKHLHMAVDPVAVADAIEEAVGALHKRQLGLNFGAPA